jgi:hypothetical protein
MIDFNFVLGNRIAWLKSILLGFGLAAAVRRPGRQYNTALRSC